MPFINGRYYINPAYGRALERNRAAEAARHSASKHNHPLHRYPDGLHWDPAISGLEPTAGNERDPQHRDENGHWVTIDHRHVWIDETRDKIVRTARKHNGSTDWAFAKKKDNFPAYTNKCNKFVYDVTKEAGAEASVIGSDGKPRPPLAAEWADPHTPIPGWRVVGPNEAPQPGDVAAYKLPGHTDYTGHSGIVTGVDANGTVHAIAAHGYVVGSDDKFNSTQSRTVTYRRYMGGQ